MKARCKGFRAFSLVVDNIDVSLVALALDTDNAKYDVNNDSAVNVQDLLEVSESFFPPHTSISPEKSIKHPSKDVKKRVVFREKGVFP